MRPAIPINVKLLSETDNPNPKLLMTLATTLPNALPITMVGMKTPPAPPAPMVVVMAIALKMVIPNRSAITTQILSVKASKGVVPRAFKWSPSNRLLMNPKPSP